MAKEAEKAVPPEGSLSLLALGAQGLRAWRRARALAEQPEPTKADTDG